MRESDTLPLIAYRKYGDATQWRPIAALAPRQLPEHRDDPP
jgi:nucleoid-associated protein YgaU